MKIERIGWGAARLGAIKAGHWFAKYTAELFGNVTYLSERELAHIRPMLDAYIQELKGANSALVMLRASYEQCDEERERAIDGWYEESGRREELERHNRVLKADNFRFMAERETATHRLAIAGAEGAKKETPQVAGRQRYLERFLESCKPRPRDSEASIYSNGHQTDHHKRPRRFDRFVARLSSSEFVTGIHTRNNPPAQTKGKDMKVGTDNGKYFISVPYSDGGFGATVRADITAETQAQAEYTLHNLMHLLGKL